MIKAIKTINIFQRNIVSVLKNPFTINNYMKKPHPHNFQRHHGRIRVDEYHEHFQDQANVQKFIKQEQQTFSKESQKWKGRIHHYYEQTNQRKDKRDQSLPEVFKNHEYLTKVSWYKDREYTKIFRRKIGTNKQEQVLDIMKYSSIKQNYNTVELVSTVFSNSERYMAFGFDELNDERVSFMIKDMEKNSLVGVKGWQNNKLSNVSQVVFDGDKGLFYTKVINSRSSQLWYQNIDSGQRDLIYKQENPQYGISIRLSTDQRYLFVDVSNREGNELMAIDLQNYEKGNKKPFKVVGLSTRSNAQHISGFSNEKSFVLWKIRKEGHSVVNRHHQTQQQTILYEAQKGQEIQDVDVFQSYIVLYSKHITKPKITIIQINQQGQLKTSYTPQLPYNIGSVCPGANKVFETHTFLAYFNSPFVYNEGYQYNMQTRKWTVKEKCEFTGKPLQPQKYLIQSKQVPSLSGQTIPLTIIVPKKNKKVRNKMILCSYGYYGLPYQVKFNNVYITALEEGWSIAYAHIRGGNQKGKQWHLSAIKDKRDISWKDLEDCVALLLKQQYTHPSLLVLYSHSAGAITAWNIANRNPHLFKAIVLNVPFLDVLTTLLNDKQYLSNTDYTEFGNPITSLNSYNQIQSYSPYETINNISYPFLYIVGGINDYRCPVSQIGKFVNKFRERSQPSQRFSLGNKGCLVKINDGSHEGIANISSQLWEGCEIMGTLDYLIEQRSTDCELKQ